ncbi:hypothetical protein AC579_10019 [Pseudocercospora musae]|uniref:SnoaL-like domain-containing protein n=1 Tax=Pseudocercospora musae TaxID=113226 RepID=A0A139IHI3_9PEZI|nr:hypothetical protein AC579_10019 [Pseudocercospora musae]
MRLLYGAAVLLLPWTAARPGDSPPVAPDSYKSSPVEALKGAPPPPSQPYSSPPPPPPPMTYGPPKPPQSAPAYHMANATCTNMTMNATNSANNYTTLLPPCSNAKVPTPPYKPANNTNNATVPSPPPHGPNSTNTTSPPPPPPPPIMTYGPNTTNATNTTLPSPQPHGLNATNMTTPRPSPPSPPYLTYGSNTTNMTNTTKPAPSPYGANMTNMTAPPAPGPYGGKLTNSTNTTLPSPPVGGNMTNTTMPNITIPIPPYKMNTTTNLTYCVIEAATTIEQATLFSEFVDLIWKEADMKTALVKHVSKDLIKHDCDAEGGLAPPGRTVVERVAFDGGAGWVHSMSSEDMTAYVDIYRFEGTCIVEHWYLTQKMTNCTKSYAL